jgi:hypothetical protein
VEAELDLRRIRAARWALWGVTAPSTTPETYLAPAEDAAENPPVVDDHASAAVMLERLPQIQRLERYERRAMSRRKKALRALMG